MNATFKIADNHRMHRSRGSAVLSNQATLAGTAVMCIVLAINRIVYFLVLSAAVLVLEWTVMCKPNIDHGKLVGYGGY